MNTTITLTEQELAHVLAGLLMLRDTIVVYGPRGVKESREQFANVDIFTPEAIYELCERINCAEEPRVSIRVDGGCVVGVRSTIPVSVNLLDEDCDWHREEFESAKSEHYSIPLEVY